MVEGDGKVSDSRERLGVDQIREVGLEAWYPQLHNGDE